ncbi:malonate decarboxylase holo-[acyl-carrier-protein] synthase [Beijerinckia sp. L45]|uniref:malonate decarboxylase holo-[acyl-carrier-protein] synthase n=1 Tax=Beijerinckia sp. L45 TaxID=1641855 RepID=UPI00131A9366|nr:malonate decarboxylase holo-[acyl-carrier-protein] synthase [Beijerinckia sp. L45]
MVDPVLTPRSGWRRHDLLRVAPSAWGTMLIARPDLAQLPFVKDWAGRGWPVMVRRAMDGDDPAMVPIGIPLPPAAGKLRIGLVAPERDITAHTAPPPLRVVQASAPVSWKPTIAALIELGADHGVDPQLFGSLLWQHETGLTYLSATSDLDLLWPVADGCDVRALLDGIASVEQAAPVRIDGELVFADGRAVNWREFWTVIRQAVAGTILVKTNGGVSLQDVEGVILGRAA